MDFGADLPEITVVTVVFNGAAYLKSTIDSVLSLSYPRLSYIVIDGGSTDGTVEIIKKYAAAITYWVSEKDNGIYDAMNKGWAACREGSFVLFLGAGDRIVSLPSMENYGKDDVLYGKVELGGGRVFTPNAGASLRLRNSLHHQALLVNKSLHPEPPFDTSFKLFADFDFNQRLMKRGANFVYHEALVGYAMPEGVSSRYDLCEALRVVRKNFGVGWAALSLCYFLARRSFVRTRDFLSPGISAA